MKAIHEVSFLIKFRSWKRKDVASHVFSRMCCRGVAYWWF